MSTPRLRWLVAPSTTESVLIRVPEGRAIVALALEDSTIAGWSVSSDSASSVTRSHMWDATSGCELLAPSDRSRDQHPRLEIGGPEGGWGAPVRVHDRGGGVVVLPTDDETNLRTAAASRDGTHVVAGGYGLEGGVIEVWNVSAAQLIAHIDTDEHIRSVAMSKSGGAVLSGNSRGVLELWRLDDKARRATRKVHEGSIDVIALSDDGRVATASNEDGTVRVTNLARTGEAPAPRHPDPIVDVVFSVDGARLVTRSENGTTWLWDTATGAPIRCLYASGGRVLEGGTARRAIFAGAHEIVSLAHGGATWSAIDGSPLKEPGEARLFVRTRVTIAPDGENVLLLEPDNVARAGRLRDPASWVPIARNVTAHAFSSNGRNLALAMAQGRVEVSDVAARRGIAAFDNGEPVSALAVTNEGRCITAGESCTMQVWDVTPSVRCVHTFALPEVATGVEAMSNDRCVTVSPTSTVRRWALQQGGCVEWLTGVVDFCAFAVDREWRALIRDRKFTVESSRGETIASTPTSLRSFTTHPSRAMWAGAVGNDLHWLVLES